MNLSYRFLLLHHHLMWIFSEKKQFFIIYFHHISTGSVRCYLYTMKESLEGFYVESYLEISFLHNACTIMLSVLLGEYAATQPLSMRRVGIYAIMISTIGCFGWFPYAGLAVFIVEVAAFFFLFTYAWKTYMSALVLRTLFYLSAFVFYGGGFHNGLWFVPIHSGIIALWIIYGILALLMITKWKDTFARLSYVYECVLILQEKRIHFKSYLDSGNLMTYHQIPVLFMDKKYQTYFKKQRIELVVMNSIGATEVIRCYECEVQIAGCKKQRVYIHCDRHLELPFHCEVLLNMNVMTMG